MRFRSSFCVSFSLGLVCGRLDIDDSEMRILGQMQLAPIPHQASDCSGMVASFFDRETPVSKRILGPKGLPFYLGRTLLVALATSITKRYILTATHGRVCLERLVDTLEHHRALQLDSVL